MYVYFSYITLSTKIVIPDLRYAHNVRLFFQLIERIEVGFDPIEYPVTEGETAVLRVVLNMNYTKEITVSLQTNEGSATGND